MTLYTSLLDEIKGQATAEGSNRLSSGQVGGYLFTRIDSRPFLFISLTPSIREWYS